MHREYSAGAVIYRKGDEGPLFLFVCSRKNGSWGFPKGHIEAGEDEMTAARREIAEETGAGELLFLNGFRVEEVYPAISKRAPYKGQEIEKHSIYYLCRTGEAAVSVDGKEITDYRWLTAAEGERLLPFENSRELLRKANAFITEGRHGEAQT